MFRGKKVWIGSNIFILESERERLRESERKEDDREQENPRKISQTEK